MSRYQVGDILQYQRQYDNHPDTVYYAVVFRVSALHGAIPTPAHKYHISKLDGTVNDCLYFAQYDDNDHAYRIGIQPINIKKIN